MLSHAKKCLSVCIAAAVDIRR